MGGFSVICSHLKAFGKASLRLIENAPQVKEAMRLAKVRTK